MGADDDMPGDGRHANQITEPTPGTFVSEDSADQKRDSARPGHGPDDQARPADAVACCLSRIKLYPGAGSVRLGQILAKLSQLEEGCIRIILEIAFREPPQSRKIGSQLVEKAEIAVRLHHIGNLRSC